MAGSAGFLTDAERRTLTAICGALLPAIPPGPADNPALFALDAETLGVAGAVEAALGVLSARQRDELRFFLRLLEHRAFMMIAARMPARFGDMDAVARERALQRMSNSFIPAVRTGFQALKRLATFLFYAVPTEGENPAWSALDYRRPVQAPATAALRLASHPAGHVLEADACVVGSGAGGGVVAARLAEAGLSVIVLEAGSADQASDYVQRELTGTQRLYLDQGTTASRDLGVAILAGAGIGGGTSVNWQTSLRTPDFIRQEWAQRSGVHAFLDGRFERALDAVCERLSVGTGESDQNANNAALARGCTALGFHWTTIPRNANGCDQSQCGFCVFGCRVGGKQSTMNTYLRDAQGTGRCEVLANCRANRVLIENNRAVGVAATLRDTSGATEIRVRAGTVVVAAGAIETPALLLRSELRHPQIGRNLHLHPTSAVAGRYATTIHGWEGAPQSVLADHFSRRIGNYGYRFETAPVHPGLIALAQPWYSARNHRERMQHVGSVSAIIVLTRDRGTGRVRVDGEGRAVIEYSVGRMEQRLLREGIANAARIHCAAGATEIHTLHSTDHTFRRSERGRGADIDGYARLIASRSVASNRCGVFSAHQMGTARLGLDARANVCGPHGNVHGVDGLFVADASLFPASSGVNPMITIMALAHMVGGEITRRPA